MSVIEQKFRAWQCYDENGVYFPDDTFITLNENNLPLLPARNIAEILGVDPDGWTNLDQTGQLTTDAGLLLSWGETSWEGAGYLALLNAEDGSLRWLLHSNSSEPFTHAIQVGNAIHAASADYITVRDWIIPIDEPWRLSVQRHNRLLSEIR